MTDTPLDLFIDLNSMDETGLPWSFLDEATDPSRIVAGAYIVVGGGSVRAVAQVVDITDDGIVHVRPLSGPLSDHAHLLRGRAAS
jgi:hypothetical protein